MTSGADDLASVDEVKVYEDEGEEEEEGKSSENLSEEKAVLVTESEDNKGQSRTSNEDGSLTSGAFFPFHPAFPYTSLFYQGLSGRFAALSPSLYMHCKDKLSLPVPPPAHMGYPPRLPPYGNSPFFPFRPTDYTQLGALPGFPALSPSMLTSRSPFLKPPSSTSPAFLPFPFPPSSPIKLESSATPPSSENAFRNPFFFPGLRHNGLLTTEPRFLNRPPFEQRKDTPKKPLIKKPLNAFMLFMKEMRQSVIEECTLKESAAINQILGRKWHALDRSEQAKYYEMAKKEKEIHAQKYPGWSARDNYALSSKKKRKRLDNIEHSSDSDSSRPSKLRYNINNHEWTNNNGSIATEDSFSPLPNTPIPSLS